MWQLFTVFCLIMNKKGEAHDELEEKIYVAASFLVSLFVCGTALAAGNDAFADTPAQGKEKIKFTGSGTENNANDITETEASATESGSGWF